MYRRDYGVDISKSSVTNDCVADTGAETDSGESGDEVHHITRMRLWLGTNTAGTTVLVVL